MAKLGEITAASLLWLLHAADHPDYDHTTHTTQTLLTTPHYPVVVLLDLNSALTVECDEAGIRQIASWETQSATGGPLGASRTRSTRPNPDVIGPLQFSPLLEYDHDDDHDLQSSKEQLGLDQYYQTLSYISELKCHM